MRILIFVIAIASLGAAQETRREATAPATPADRRPNSPQVPEVYAIPSQFERVLIFRFKFDTDLLAGLEQMIAQNNIRNAVILSAFGSVRNYQVHQVGNRSFPAKNVFVKNPSAPADVLGMSGYVLGGRLHAHISLAKPDKAFGGHLEPGTNVFTFMVVTVGVLPDNLDLSKLDDYEHR